jgi:hypothetical protein
MLKTGSGWIELAGLGCCAGLILEQARVERKLALALLDRGHNAVELLRTTCTIVASAGSWEMEYWSLVCLQEGFTVGENYQKVEARFVTNVFGIRNIG